LSHSWPAAAIAAVLLLATACGGSRNDLPADPLAPAAAVYRVRFDPGAGGTQRRFRLLVHAADPDRLHGEIVSAVGTTELVLDAGAEGVSVLFVRDRVAYVGAADERALDALLGVPLAPRTMVDVLRGRDPGISGLEWVIVPGDRGYPREISLSDGPRRLSLELKRLRPIRADPATFGTGRPPAGVETRALELLDPDSVPGIETDDEGRT
jgi:hypothetical protein